jgi:hypothetical protein
MSRWFTPPFVIPIALVLFAVLGWLIRTHG